MTMLKNKDIQIRDPFVFPVLEEETYVLFGSTDKNIWGKGAGFDAYTSHDLQYWDGPYNVFCPEADFYSDTNFWAPEVYSYEGQYYMFATFRRKDNQLLGTAVLTADHLLGPYKPHSDGPVTPQSWSSLDGSLFCDEEGQPWMIFCHEWQQIADGEVCAMRLSSDLRRSTGEPILLFRASEARWTAPFISARFPGQQNYVTDGPYLFRASSNELYMLWASFVSDNTYALGIAKSPSGRVSGPWLQEEKPLYQNDGGHAMVFRTYAGQLMLAIHTPNQTPDERPLFLPLHEQNGKIVVASEGEEAIG